MPAEPNLTGIARLVVLGAGVAMASWALWGADEGWHQIVWLILGGVCLVLSVIGYLPLIPKKVAKSN